MTRTKQLTVSLPNKPGMLAKACRALADAKVNILAISASTGTEMGTIRLVTDNPKAAAAAMEAIDLQVVQTPVRLIELPNKMGSLAEWSERLGKRKVNINYLYGSVPPSGTKAILVTDAHAS